MSHHEPGSVGQLKNECDEILAEGKDQSSQESSREERELTVCSRGSTREGEILFSSPETQQGPLNITQTL
jgi:hypothetical protein